jgi:hypothetical protein
MKNEMDGAYGTHQRDEKRIQNLFGIPEENDHLGDVGIDGRIIFSFQKRWVISLLALISLSRRTLLNGYLWKLGPKYVEVGSEAQETCIPMSMPHVPFAGWR